ncbi:MAG: TerC/Alx family metal homeostasis membrane protein [Deltaproteobacteria bacterium]|jgi:tellurite resistance protein TerC|nr:TerC/Alx family metal homeostasis membrane protein [Deltaproteobacteria bacterium]
MLDDYSLFSVILFCGLVFTCLIIDLRAHKTDEVVSATSAALWTLFWIALSLCFGGYIWYTHGVHDFSLFLSGYLLEKSLSVDNLFVIMAVFSAFSVKDNLQHRVLYYGIVGALLLRLIFVALGSSFLILCGNYALVIFGLFVLWSAWKMWKTMGKDQEEIEDYTNHWSVRLTRRFLPVHTKLAGHAFFVRTEQTAGESLTVTQKAKWAATPLFLCLVAIEFADVMFAFDSVPAIIAITEKPFLVYTSNIFAILGLRSMYFFLSAAKRYLIHLEKAVICILVYIGLKMLVTVAFDYHTSALASLAVVLGLLAAGVAASFIFKPKTEQDES